MCYLRAKMDKAAGDWGRGMALYERGEISGRDLGTLKRRATVAETVWRAAQYAVR